MINRSIEFVTKVYNTGTGLIRTQTARDSGVLFTGSFINSLLSLVAVIYVSRELGPEQFGILATFNAVYVTLIGLTNFGLDTAAIKIISSHIVKDERKAHTAMRVLIKIELLLGILIGISGVIFAVPIANVLGGEHLTFAVQLAFFAAAFGSAAAFIGPFLVSYRKFKENAIVGVLGGLIRTITILILASAASLTISNVLWAYAVVPIIFFFAGLLIAPKGWRVRASRSEQKESFKEIFHFSKWILLSYVATVIAGKLDVFLISTMLGTTSVGLYAAAQQLASIMPLIIGAISTAVLPRFSQFAEENKLHEYYKKTFLAVSILAFCLSPIILIGDDIVTLVFGDKFTASIEVFQILFAAYLIALLGNILSLTLYAVNKPKILTYINYLGLATTVIFYPVLISLFGINGAAWAFLLNNLMGTILSIIFSYRAVKK